MEPEVIGVLITKEELSRLSNADIRREEAEEKMRAQDQVLRSLSIVIGKFLSGLHTKYDLRGIIEQFNTVHSKDLAEFSISEEGTIKFKITTKRKKNVFKEE